VDEEDSEVVRVEVDLEGIEDEEDSEVETLEEDLDSEVEAEIDDLVLVDDPEMERLVEMDDRDLVIETEVLLHREMVEVDLVLKEVLDQKVVIELETFLEKLEEIVGVDSEVIEGEIGEDLDLEEEVEMVDHALVVVRETAEVEVDDLDLEEEVEMEVKEKPEDIRIN
jgi:hypothetical protein